MIATTTVEIATPMIATKNGNLPGCWFVMLRMRFQCQQVKKKQS